MLAVPHAYQGRHVRPVSRRRRAAAAAAVIATSGLALTLPSAGVASAADACTTPQLSDVMFSQGLPSYTALVAGKPALVKLFLSTPSCLPVGATVSVTGAQLFVSSSANPIPIQASVPLPPIGPASTAPVPATASDLTFLVPGDALQPQGTSSVNFSATVNYRVQTSAGTVADKVVFSQATTNLPMSATVLPNPDPLNLLVVPLGNTAVSASTQYTDATRAGVQAGLDTLRRLYPVADANGLNAFENAGMVNVGSTPWCGTAGSFQSVTPALETTRVVWNATNGVQLPSRPAAPHMTRVLGEIDQNISTGPSTSTTQTSCADGYAQVGNADADATVAFTRVVRSSTQGYQVTGSIQAMELAHTTGAVDPAYPFNATAGPNGTQRADAGYHSFNQYADVTAPGRGYNLSSRQFLATPPSFMQYSKALWSDAVTLGERQDWDYLMCALYPPRGTPGSITSQLGATTPEQLTTCANPGRMGYSAAAAAATYGSGNGTNGTFAVAGATDGTAAGTSVYSTDSASTDPDPQAPGSQYRLVQRNGASVLSDVGVPMHSVAEDHDGDGAGSPLPPLPGGTFGIAVPAQSATTSLELWKGEPGTTGAVRLYARSVQPTPPTFNSVDVSGHSVTITANSTDPADLRLDVILTCDGSPSSPLTTNVAPSAVAAQSAVFVTSYDASLGCPNGRLAYHLTDGTRSATQTGSAVNGGRTVSGEITSPYAGQRLIASQSIGLSGSATDSSGHPAARYSWAIARTLSSGAVTEYPVAAGSTTAVPPTGGFPLPGSYEAVMRAYDASGALLTAVRQPFVERADSDGDGIPDDEEQQPCYASTAVNDPRNANADSDGDGLANIDDPQPCVSINNVTVGFNPQSLYKSASGNVVTVYLSRSAVALSTLSKADLYITQIAGYSATRLTGSANGLPAVSYTLTSPTTATVQFDRSALVKALGPALGYTPIFVGTLDGRVRGDDPTYPTVFP